MSPEWIPAITKAVTEQGLLGQIYGDLAKPGVSQVGTALSTVLGLGNTLLWPIQLLNERARISLLANLDRYREKMSSVPPEKVTPVAPEVGVPIAEKLGHVADPDLRELYTNLLARASNVDTQSQAHPSFVNVIDNMSPDEALLIKQFQRQGGTSPFITGRFVDPKTNYWLQVVDVHLSIQPETNIVFPDNLPAYLSNLEGLGLINVRQDEFIVPESVYDALKLELTNRYSGGGPGEYSSFQCTRGKIQITKFGWLFVSACIADS